MAMMGPRQVAQGALFYEFSLENHVPADHLLRAIDRFVDLSGIRRELARFYSAIGRPSIDPELMIRMLLVGYIMGVRSERRLCEEVHLNLAYRWFCRLDLTDPIPDHSTFSKNRHGRFRDSDLLRRLFETVVARCNATPIGEWSAEKLDPASAPRAVREYLDTLDDAAFGAATEKTPKFTAHADPASQWTGALKGPAFFAYADNYLIDTDHAIIVDVEATRAVRQAETGAARTMIDRTMDRFGLYPAALAADTAYGSADMLGWLVEERGIEPHIPVFDKSGRRDGAFPATDFVYDHRADAYACPGGKMLKPYWRDIARQRPEFGPDGVKRYFARKQDCAACALKPRCTPNQPTRKLSRSRFEGARQMAREIADTDAYVASSHARKKVEMLFAHLKRILGLGRLRLRGPCGARDEFLLAATAQNLRKLAKLIFLRDPALA
jgi:transposase